jgi:hypothetical protein
MPILLQLLFLLVLVLFEHYCPQLNIINISRVNNVYNGDNFCVDIDQQPLLIGKNKKVVTANLSGKLLLLGC